MSGGAERPWLAALRAAARQPARAPRLPFAVAGVVVGTVEAGFWDQIGPMPASDGGFLLSKDEQFASADGQPGWHLRAARDQATAALNQLARHLQGRGLCGPWRHEQLGVLGPDGQRLATVERGAVRVLGLATQAVHLVACAPDGRMWVQQRAFNKPNDPGLWDTVMGGMVSAADSLAQALARETWEEAGLRVAELQALAHGGHVDFCRPSSEAGGAGYMVERIDWFRATVPDGMVPENQDGEVEQFELLDLAALEARLAAGQFTLEAALIAAAALGW